MERTRRAYLATTGALAVGTAGVAGCLGSSTPDVDTSYDCELTDSDPVSHIAQPSVGDPNAEVTVELFEDFACPHCSTFARNSLPALKSEYAGSEVRFEHHDYLVVDSVWNGPVANAARSIQAAHGDETFFEFATAAYEKYYDYSWQRIGTFAEEVGADPCQVLSDASNGTFRDVIEANTDRAEDLRVPGTPGARVDGTVLDEVASYDSISRAIEQAL